MGNRFGIFADHLVEYVSECTCGIGSILDHSPHCGIEPVMTVTELAAIVDAPVNYAHPGVWKTPDELNSNLDPEFEIYVSTQDNTIKTHIDTNWHSPLSARAFAMALILASFYAEEKEQQELAERVNDG